MLTGYVLAGGKSSRMGTSKAALRLGETTFVRRAAAVLQSVAAARVHLVINESQREAIDFRFTNNQLLVDLLPERGALGGIHTALTHAQTGWAVILAVDYPFVTAELLVGLQRIAQTSAPETAAVVPVQPDGRAQPLCAFYRVESCLSATAELLADDSTPPARELLKTVETRLVEFSEIKDLPNSALFFTNVNNAQDYEHAVKTYQQQYKSL